MAALPSDALDDIWLTNVAAPPRSPRPSSPCSPTAEGPRSHSSDAAVEHYEGWGGYAASKAALDHLTLTLAAENPGLAAYAVDPGDMDGDAPGRLPRRGHQRPPAAGDGRAPAVGTGGPAAAQRRYRAADITPVVSAPRDVRAEAS